MKHLCLLAVALVGLFGRSTVQAEIGWKSLEIHDRFYTEGCSIGDLDGDGHMDIVAGPMWFAGPTFDKSHPIAEPKAFPVAGYSDQFFSFVVDANADGALDVIAIGFPGQGARLYVNPGRGHHEQLWKMHEITGAVDNESPTFADLIVGGLPEIVCGAGGQYGCYVAGDDPTAPWTWKPVTRGGACGGMFAHGLGVGDIDNDGRMDLLDKDFWWQQPANDDGSPWQQHQWNPNPSGGGAHIRSGDIDGDGDIDIVSSINAHGYGLAWYEQIGPDEFKTHTIMGDNSQANPFGIVFSQMHAVEFRDIDGDGLNDIVTGKRFLAHGGHDVGGLQEPVLYWFECQRTDDGVQFVPHLIHNDSGVGVDVAVEDLNGDGRLDVVSSSKHGLAFHLQAEPDDTHPPMRWQVSEGKDQTKYADGWTPEEAAKNMLVPDGFSVDLIAAEPELTQPIAMCFDARGRIWVIEGHTYPAKAPEGKGRDRILILSDTDADGSFETSKVFAEGLNLASGIEVGFGGVWVGAAPELLFFPDADMDDVPDDEPTILLDGWAYQDTHETLNSFTWGPDGWLYGCHGVFTHSNVGKPGTPDDQRQPINAGLWRYHPTRHVFEVYAHGTSNPWGVDYNDQGDWFVTACVIEHLFHLQQGGRYRRQAGNHFNPYTYDDIKTIADHAHYAGNWTDVRGDHASSLDQTSQLGGGHAHCGLAIYDGDVFPAQYRGRMFFNNLHGHRVVSEQLERNGSGYVGRHRPDFALSQDHQQIGVGIMVGPDGALYTSDWHDPQTCHNTVPEIWNRTDGRMFRIRYGDVRPQSFDLWNESDMDLVARLGGDNGFMARQAARIIQERMATGKLDREAVVKHLNQTLASESSQRDRLRSLWLLGSLNELDERDWLRLLADSDPYVRSWAIQFQGQLDEPLSPATQVAMGDLSRNDPSQVVRRYLASLANRLPLDQRLPILAGLTSHGIDRDDPNISMLVWYALEPIADADPGKSYVMAKQSGWPNLHRFVVRRSATTPSGRNSLAQRLALIDDQGEVRMILDELMAAAVSRGGTEMPAGWPDAFKRLRESGDASIGDLSRALAVQFGDPSVLPHFRSVLADANASKQQRDEALRALLAVKDPMLVDQLIGLLDEPAMSTSIVSAMGRFSDPRTAPALLSRMNGFDDETRTAALTVLASRPDDAASLVAAMESGKIASATVPAFVVRQITSINDAAMTTRLEKVWGHIAPTSADKKSLYEKYRRILSGWEFDKADRQRGRVLYEANCGKCHQLFGEGGEIGPNITGANRTSVDYWLENILEPNGLIGRDYLTTKYLMDDGRIVIGLVKESNDDAVTVQTATEKLVLSRDEIEQEVASQTSLMPEGQLEPMSDEQVRQLFNYLRSPTQVALP